MSNPLEGQQPFQNPEAYDEAFEEFMQRIEAFGGEPCVAVVGTGDDVHAIYTSGTQVAKRIQMLVLKYRLRIIGVFELASDLFDKRPDQIRKAVNATVEKEVRGWSEKMREKKAHLHNGFKGPEAV